MVVPAVAFIQPRHPALVHMLCYGFSGIYSNDSFWYLSFLNIRESPICSQFLSLFSLTHSCGFKHRKPCSPETTAPVHCLPFAPAEAPPAPNPHAAHSGSKNTTNCTSWPWPRKDGEEAPAGEDWRENKLRKESRFAASSSVKEAVSEVSRGSAVSKVCPLNWNTRVCVGEWRVQGGLLMGKASQGQLAGRNSPPCLLFQHHSYRTPSILVHDCSLDNKACCQPRISHPLWAFEELKTAKIFTY